MPLIEKPAFANCGQHFASPASWQCFADVGPSLSQLASAGYRLAIASNFDRRLHAVCDSLEHLKSIDCRIVSASAGIRKPAPNFYATVIEACNCLPHQILMVGDNREHDVLAPIAAGLNALHLDRSATGGSSDSLMSLNDLVARTLADWHESSG